VRHAWFACVPADLQAVRTAAWRGRAGYFACQEEPKVLLTTCYKPSKLMFELLADLLDVLPVAYYYKRQAGPAAPAPHAQIALLSPLCASGSTEAPRRSRLCRGMQ
jgi:hypothetical protein